jgi:hypothetical protein
MTAALARTFAVMDDAAGQAPSANQDRVTVGGVRPLRRKRATIMAMSPLARPLALFPFFRP